MRAPRMYLGQIYFVGHKVALVFAIQAASLKQAKEMAREQIRWKHGSFAKREIELETWRGTPLHDIPVVLSDWI